MHEFFNVENITDSNTVRHEMLVKLLLIAIAGKVYEMYEMLYLLLLGGDVSGTFPASNMKTDMFKMVDTNVQVIIIQLRTKNFTFSRLLRLLRALQRHP